MITETLTELYKRDLEKLKAEISLFKEEKDLWRIGGEITNSSGNLCLHLLGNLNHFIGATLGNTGYIRQRDDEFNLRHIPRQKLLNQIDLCSLMLKETLGKLTEEDLAKDFPLIIRDQKTSTEQILVHLFGHFSYHLGQINYLRRSLN